MINIAYKQFTFALQTCNLQVSTILTGIVRQEAENAVCADGDKIGPRARAKRKTCKEFSLSLGLIAD